MKVIQESWLRRNKKSNDSSLFPFYYKSTLLLFNYSDMSSSLRSHGKAPGFLSFTISQSLLKLMSMESVMPFNHLILCHPLLFLLSIFPSIRVFSNVLALCIKWPKYWSFSFNTSLSSKYSRLISFRIDWFDLLAVQGTLKSLSSTTVQKHQLILWCSAFLMVQLSHPYMTTGKIIG